VSAIEPPFAATVFASTPVGTPTTVAVMVSPHCRAAVDAEVAESTVTLIRTKAAVVAESPPTTVSEVAPVGPTATDIEVAATAFAGTTAEVNPIPKAATVASAIRLKVVFVDILFLSLVVKKTFFFTAGKEILFAS
jgi:hypothetical protein